MDFKNFRKNCPLCGKIVGKNFPFFGETTIICPNCSLVFNYNLSDTGFKKEWEEFSFNLDVSEYDFAKTAFFEDLWNYVRRLVQKRKGRMLDIGCGKGIMLKMAKSSGWQAEGVELSQRLCQKAENYSGCRVFEGPVEQLSISQETYDIILMIDTFRHLENPLATLKQCATLCKKSGVIVIRDLNIEELTSRKRFSRSLNWDFQCLSKRTAKFFMERAGIKNVQFFPSPMSLLTIPIIKNIHKKNPKISNKLRQIFNKIVKILYFFSFRRWLTITPQMLIIGKKE